MAEGVEKDSLQDSLAQNESAQPFWDNFFPTTAADTTTAQPSMQVWGHLRISNPWLPVRSRIGAFYAANKEQTMMAIHRAIERRDPFNPDQPADPQVIVELEGASLLVPVIFHSQLGQDYFTSILNGPFLKSCLKTELERVGYTEPILVTAEKQGLPHTPSLSLDEEIKDVLEKMRQATVQLSKQPKQDQTENKKSDTQTSAPKQERTLIGGNGVGKSPFEYPSGVAVSEEGEIFVADCYSKRIQIFSEDSATEFITIHGDETIEPSDVAIDGEGKLWVVGYRNTADYAVRYTKQGKRLAMFKLQVETEWLRGIAVDVEKNHVLVTQTTGEEPNLHGEVMVFTPDGTAVRTVGGQQGMRYPRYITVDGEGRILVADSNNNCIYVYKEGQLQLKFGNTGKKKERSEGMLNNPRGICTDSSGNVIVADSGNHRVKMFDKRGRFLKHVATDMPRPQAVAMTPQGQLVVTDTEEDTVMIFDSLLGSMKCGSDRCMTCEHLEEGATFSSHATEESFQMKDSMTCRSTYIIYLVSCSKCGLQYVGETKEELRTKFSSHVSSINQNKTSALAKHFNSAGHSMKNVRVRPIVQIESRGDQLRKDEEAFWIETLHTEAPEGMNLTKKAAKLSDFQRNSPSFHLP